MVSQNIFVKLAIALASLSLSLLTLKANPTQAAIITYDFTVNATSGPLQNNQYNGFFSYDDAVSSGAGPLLLPFFEVSDFRFDFIDTTRENRFTPRTYTRGDLIIDGRAFPESLPLEFSGGETIVDPQTGQIGLLPRGGELVRFAFSNFNRFEDPSVNGFWTLSSDNGFLYFIGFNPEQGEDFISGSGNVTFSLRQPGTTIPEPKTPFIGVSVLALGWLLRKKSIVNKQKQLSEQ